MESKFCRFCGRSGCISKKKSPWMPVCIGCYTTLNRMLKSGKYGSSDSQSTIDRLLTFRYEWETGKWVENSKFC